MTEGFAYVDEAGDFGCGTDASEFATLGIAYVIGRRLADEETQIRRLLKTINTRINSYKKISEFRFSSNIDKIKNKALRGMLKLDINFGVMAISKDSVSAELQNSDKLLYSHSLAEGIGPLIDKYLDRGEIRNKLHIIIDRRLYKPHIEPFDKYLRGFILTKIHNANPLMNIDIMISHEDSQKIPMLQVADYVASSTYRKIALGDPTYYDIISGKIRYHVKWDWNNKIDW